MTIITERRNPPKDLTTGERKKWIAEECDRMGYPIAGFVEDIYEDAVIMIPGDITWDWEDGSVLNGRVLSVSGYNGGKNFVLIDENGTQTSHTFRHDYPCRFALPEDSEEAFR